MPIADAIDMYWPACLFGVEPSCGSDGDWFALKVRPRCEKKVARELRRHSVSDSEIGYFLPMSSRTRSYQRRKVTSQHVLFPGYVFARGAEAEVRAVICKSSAVVACLLESDQERLHDSLRTLRLMIDAGGPVTVEERLKPGMAVEIVKGPLVGCRGHVIENQGGLRFLVKVDFIQNGASVSISGEMVRAA